MSHLNARQQAAVKKLDGPLLVIAGAGSGKTRVITEKIAYLVQRGTAARHIAALTFTNKSAREMKSRVVRLVDRGQTRGLRISTFHALGLEILRREHRHLGYQRSALSIFDEQDRIGLLKNLCPNSDTDAVQMNSRLIGQWKSALTNPRQALSGAADEDVDCARLYEGYARALKAYNAVDLDDLILQPVLLFQQNTERLEHWRNRIRYLLVDEYQDTNQAQYELLKLLAGPLGKFTVVGDDDQSIYAWRGAKPDNLEHLQTDFPRLEVIKLEQNYRSSRRILKVANQLIDNNPHVYKKRLWSELGKGDRLRVLSHADEITEAQQVVSEILLHKLKTGASFSDYAILYRSNHQSRPFERALREQSMPYRLSGGASFFGYFEVKDILAYLRLFVNQDDDPAFLRIVNTPRREIGPKTLVVLSEYANQRGVSLFAASFELGLQHRLGGKSALRLRRFCEWMVDTADRVDRGDTFAVIEEFIETLEYPQWLRDQSQSEKAAERRIGNVYELINWLKRLADADGQDLKLDEVIAKIMLLDILDRQQEDEVNDQVHLMTLHAAKGLEFRHVYLVGMEENLLPHQTSVDDGNIEEERRLAYVGITRAQNNLAFSYCSNRKRYGETIDCEPSRFLNELPDEDLEWPEKCPPDPHEVKARGEAALTGLRDLLSTD